MKKKKLFSVLLAALLFVNAWTLPVRAETEPTGGAEDTVPAVTMPSTVDRGGDLSVSNGAHSIDAQMSLVSIVEHQANAKAALLFETGTETMIYAYQRP